MRYRLTIVLLTLLVGPVLLAQVDPMRRDQLELGFDQPLSSDGPHGVYAYYHYNNPEFLRTNLALRLAVAPVYFDGELGIKEALGSATDVGLGLSGGGFGENYYEVRQGHYRKEESFYGHGGGASLSLYHRLNPTHRIPLHLVVRGGTRYTVQDQSDRTADNFELPDDRFTTFTRAGLRLAGKEPVLDPELGLELSVWYEHQWRVNSGAFGFNEDRSVEPHVDLFWAYAGLNYTWTNTGHRVNVAFTAGGSVSADRFSAWRIGAVLPLVAEFPLILPGYFYQELTAKQYVHLYGAYFVPLDHARRWQFYVEAASANLDYLSGFEQDRRWQTGAGGGLTFAPQRRRCMIVARYGFGFNSLRDDEEGAHSAGLLLQYRFGLAKPAPE